MRALAAMYVRMTFRSVEVYEILEPLMKDYRKLRYRDMGLSVPFVFRVQKTQFTAAGYSLLYFDDFIHQLLTEERACDIILPRLPKRQTLEESGEIGPRKSRLLDAMEGKSDHGGSERSRSSSHSPSRNGRASRSRSPSPYRSRSPSEAGGSRSSSVDGRYVSRSPSRSPSRSRSGSISSDRMES